MIETFRRYRDSFYDQVLGAAVRRAVFAAVIEDPAIVFERSDVLSRLDFERSVKQSSGNNDLDMLERHGALYKVFKIHRPGESYYVKLRPMVEWIVNPWYEPEGGVPRRMVEYICDRIDPDDDATVVDQLADGGFDAKEGVVYALSGRVADDGYQFEVENPDVTFETFTDLRDDDPETWGKYGLEISGRLEGDPLVVGTDAYDAVEAEFEELMQSFIKWSGHQHAIKGANALSLAQSMDTHVDIQPENDCIEFGLRLAPVMA